MFASSEWRLVAYPKPWVGAWSSEWGLGVHRDWDLVHMKNQMFSRYNMHIELSCDSRSEWEPWRAWVEPLLHDCDMSEVWIHEVCVFYDCVDNCIYVWIYPESLCTVYDLNVFSPSFCVVAYVLIWSTNNQVLEQEFKVDDVLCLFSCLSFGAIVRVALIRNTGETGCPIFALLRIFLFYFILRWTIFQTNINIEVLCQRFLRFYCLLFELFLNIMWFKEFWWFGLCE